MRKVINSIFGAAYLFIAIFTLAFLFALLHAPAFEEGKGYTLYFGANSSACALSTNCPARDKLLFRGVKGESVRYEGDRYLALKEKYGGKLLFTEEVCGVKNYYLFSPNFRRAVELNGCAVNLHIAVSAEETAIGTPLIFGGF